MLLLSYCSVFKVQNCYAILSTKLRFVCANSAAHKNFRPFIAYAKFYFIKFCKRGRLLLLVGLRGLEPPTSRLSGVRSNHLSYKPIWFSASGRRFRLPTPCGGDEEDRTPDPLLARQVLSQLSYTPIFQPFRLMQGPRNLSFSFPRLKVHNLSIVSQQYKRQNLFADL